MLRAGLPACLPICRDYTSTELCTLPCPVPALLAQRPAWQEKTGRLGTHTHTQTVGLAQEVAGQLVSCRLCVCSAPPGLF